MSAGNQDWQPIETAPDDKREVLIFEGGFITVAHRAFDGPIYHDGSTKGIYDDPVEWIPTHWMPLPKAPK